MILLQAGLILVVFAIGTVFSIFTKRISSEKIYSLTNSIEFVLSFIALTAIWSLRYNNIGLIILDIGTFLNMVVIVSNKGYMPVNMNKFKRAVSLYKYDLRDEVVQEKFRELQKKRRHIAMSNDTKFNILGDKYGHSIQSIGDILISTGILLIPFEIIFRTLKVITRFITLNTV